MNPSPEYIISERNYMKSVKSNIHHHEINHICDGFQCEICKEIKCLKIQFNYVNKLEEEAYDLEEEDGLF